ncbi:MAG: AI-2E family transporter [Cellulosilyticaceae bacterium]
MIKEIITNKKYRQTIGLVVITGVLLFIGFNLVKEGPQLIGLIGGIIGDFLHIIAPIFWAFIIAYLLYYPMMYMEKLIFKFIYKKHPTKRAKGIVRLISVATMFVLVIWLIVMLINFIVPPLITNVNILLSSLPQFEANVVRWINELNEYMTTLNISGQSIPTQNSMEILSDVSVVLKTLGEGIISLSTKVVGDVSSFVVNFVVTVILTFYFLKDKEKLFAAIDKFSSIILSLKVRKNTKQFIKDLDDIVGKFLIGTIFASFIVGVISTVLMLIIGHPFAILIGVAAGITNVIPYVGPIIGAGLAFTLGVFESLKLGILGAVLLLLYQQVDGNLIQPKIVGDKVGLAPVWILIAVLIGGSYFGGMGMILSVPTAALISVYIDRIYKCKQKNLVATEKE